MSRPPALPALLLVWLLAPLLAWAPLPVQAQDSSQQAERQFEFNAPVAADGLDTPTAMLDLAGRILPVYQDQDAERYLANLSALQLVAGAYASANESRQSLRERRESAGENLGGQAVPLDLYAGAMALETGDQKLAPDQAFQQAFRALAPKLSDREMGTAEAWVEVPPSTSLDLLQVSFDRLRAQGNLSFAEAMGLIWNYLAIEVRTELGSRMPALAAADNTRRYGGGDEAALRGRARGSEIEVRVLRPRLAGKYPALLEFGLTAPVDEAAEAAAHGYAGVVAALRPARDGAAPLYPFENAGADARKVIAWIVRQPWSDGRVAMYGAGYGGFAAWAAERDLPPALKAIATADPIAPGIDFPAPGRIFRSAAYPWALGGALAGPQAPDAEHWRALEERWYRSGKSYRALDALAGLDNLSFLRWLDHPSYGIYWQKQVPYGWRFGRIAIPVLTMTGYYSADQPGALWYYGQHRRYRKDADHTLVIGPYRGAWAPRDGNAGPQPYPVDAGWPPDLDELRWQWLDHVFKNGPKPELLKDRVNYEVMGSGEWRHLPALDAASGTPLRLYLGPAHQLLRSAAADQAPIEQAVDFRDRGDAAQPPPTGVIGGYPETRNGLAYVSQPMPQATNLAGTLSGSLDLWIDKQDADLYMTAYQLTADGSYVRLCEPYRFRASYVRDPQHRRLLKAGARQQLEFHAERFCARRLDAGSRLLLVLGVNKRPDQEINYGSGKDVDEETIADARKPLKIRWYPDSYVDVPLAR